MDEDPPLLYYLKVEGILRFDPNRDNKLEAHFIWVTNGIIRIGEEDAPFTNNAEIILHGEKEDPYMAFTPSITGNKILAVTGGLEFYG